MMLHSGTADRRGVSGLMWRLTIISSAVAIAGFAPQPALAQYRYPTFGLPSSAFAVPPGPASAPGQERSRRTGSMLQTAGPTSDLRPVSHSESEREPHRLRPAAASPLYSPGLPPSRADDLSHRSAQPWHESGPSSNTGLESSERSVFAHRRSEATLAERSQSSSVRPAPTAEPQQSPPRHDAAVSPADGRSGWMGRLPRLPDWGTSFGRFRSPQPPVERQPYRPPSGQSPPQVHQTPLPDPRPGSRPAQSLPVAPGGSGNRSAREISSAGPRSDSVRPVTVPPVFSLPSVSELQAVPDSQARRTRAELAAPSAAAEPASTAPPEHRAPAFTLMPLTEPILAPPAEENWGQPQQADPIDTDRSFTVAASHGDAAPDEAASRRQPASSSEPVDASSPAPGSAPDPDAFFLDDEDLEEGASESLEDEEFALPRKVRQPAAQSEAAETPILDLEPVLTLTPRPAKQNPRETSPYSGLRLEPEPFYEPVRRSAESTHTEGPAFRNGGLSEEPIQDGGRQHLPRVASVIAEPHRLFPDDNLNGEKVVTEEADAGLLGPGFRARSPRALFSAAPEERGGLAATPMQQIVAREGTGLKGFCPVALRDRRTLEDGRVAYRSDYAGRTYYFSSAAAKAAFDENPLKYVPAAGGYDVSLAAIARETREGSLDHAVWYRDRLYLFDSADTLKTFMAIPSAMADVE